MWKEKKYIYIYIILLKYSKIFCHYKIIDALNDRGYEVNGWCVVT